MYTPPFQFLKVLVSNLCSQISKPSEQLPRLDTGWWSPLLINETRRCQHKYLLSFQVGHWYNNTREIDEFVVTSQPLESIQHADLTQSIQSLVLVLAELLGTIQEDNMWQMINGVITSFGVSLDYCASVSGSMQGNRFIHCTTFSSASDFFLAEPMIQHSLT